LTLLFISHGTLELALHISQYPWPRSSYLMVLLTSLFISHGTLDLFIFHGTFDLALHISRYPWPLSSYLTVPLEENTYFLKLIYFLIISYVTDKAVYCCWVSVCALINDVILFIYLFSTSRCTLGYRGTPVGNHWFILTPANNKTQDFLEINLFACHPWYLCPYDKWKCSSSTEQYLLILLLFSLKIK
jgi:hypothetical protein